MNFLNMLWHLFLSEGDFSSVLQFICTMNFSTTKMRVLKNKFLFYKLFNKNVM